LTILAIDYGRAKVGLAIADDFLAQPLGVLVNKKGLLGKIVTICRKQGVKKVVIGMPEAGAAKAGVDQFADQLRKLMDFPVKFHPETLTTQEAIVKMIAAGKGRKKRRQQEDAFAAALILQDYLDKER